MPVVKNRDKIINALEEFFLTKKRVSLICKEFGITSEVFGKSLRTSLGLHENEPILYKILPNNRRLCSVCRTVQDLDKFSEVPVKSSGIIDVCLQCFSRSTRHWLGDDYEKHNFIKAKLTGRVMDALKRNKEVDCIGCSIAFLKQHIEKQFKPGMTWENHGLWQLDHIVPCALFNLTKEWQVKSCFKWENLQPLWAKENASKNDNFEVCPV